MNEFHCNQPKECNDYIHDIGTPEIFSLPHQVLNINVARLFSSQCSLITALSCNLTLHSLKYPPIDWVVHMLI